MKPFRKLFTSLTRPLTLIALLLSLLGSAVFVTPALGRIPSPSLREPIN